MSPYQLFYNSFKNLYEPKLIFVIEVTVLNERNLIDYKLGCIWKQDVVVYFNILLQHGGPVVSVFATGPKVCGFNPGRGRWIFKGDKNPEHNFLRRGRKAVGHMS
jgi:hypothetical protein